MSDNRLEETGYMSRRAFDEACQALARCAGSRSVGTSVEIRKGGHHDYLKILRPLSSYYVPPAQSDSAEHLHLSQDSNNDLESSSIEEDDDVAVYRSSPFQTVASVEYHIVHSTSYRVPVLYFFLHNLSPSKFQSMDTVYEHIVPEHLQSIIRNVGVMGGIGMVNHPLTDIPCFWVHPCNSAEAMRSILGGFSRDVSPIEYLMLWAGLVGNAVGLSLPKEIMWSGRRNRN